MMNVDVECLQDCLQIVERIVQFGDGKMPPDRRALIALLMNKFAVAENIPVDLRARLSLAEWEESRAVFATALGQALDIFQRDRATQFLN
jgi:hypothetical protein